MGLGSRRIGPGFGQPLRPRRTPWQRVLLGIGIIVAVAVLGGIGLGGYVASRDVRRNLEPTATPPPTPSALLSATASPAAAPSASAAAPARAAAVAAAIKNAVRSPALGSRLFAQVIDAETGTVLYAERRASTAAPASTAKLLTAAAVLATRGPDFRISTTVSTDGKGTLFLVGGGDPTLTSATGSTKPAYPGAARLATLAGAIRSAKVTVRRIVVVDSLFKGPSVSPAWAPEDVPSEYGAAITAVMIDGGRTTPNAVIRSSSPDIAAGHRLAAALSAPDLPVTRGLAARGAQQVAQVQSAPVSLLVEQMLQQSDNVIAECLARQVALARHSTASFLGGARSIRTTLAGLGVDVGPSLVDGSGLAASDRISASALVGVLRVVASATQPALHGIVSSLPVAGWSGTLSDRYLSGTARSGAGIVRAKTGTLTGVSTLAGLVRDRGGRLLAFALLADRVPAGEDATVAAEAALDRIAAALAVCVCQ